MDVRAPQRLALSKNLILLSPAPLLNLALRPSGGKKQAKSQHWFFRRKYLRIFSQWSKPMVKREVSLLAISDVGYLINGNRKIYKHLWVRIPPRPIF